MSVAVPFLISGSVDYPPDDGMAIAQRPFSVAGTFYSKKEAVYDLSGSGSQAVDFGTVAAAKALVVEVDADSTGTLQPVVLVFNGGSDQIELSMGGMLVYSNPNPSSGVTSLTITHTTAARVHVRILG